MRQVILALPDASMGGVTTFSINLVRGLNARGIPAHIVLTETDTERVTLTEPQTPLPTDVQVERLPVERQAKWGAHWLAMHDYLERRAPCIYIPNHNWRHSCISPKLSRGVAVVGVAHTDDPLTYDHVERLGGYWNAIVTTSPLIAAQIRARAPQLARRLTTIPIGVPTPSSPPQRQVRSDAPIRLIYHGRLVQQQKRVLDLVPILARLREAEIPFHMTIAGNGSDEQMLRAACAPFVAAHQLDFLGYVDGTQIARLLAEHDLYLLTSEYEGMPNAVLEAMAYGCVPIVPEIRSGIPSIVQDGVNGHRVAVGDSAGYTDCIVALYRDPALRLRMSQAASRTVIENGFGMEEMVERYVALFQRIEWASRLRLYRRPHGPLIPPPATVGGISILPGDYADEVQAIEFALSRKKRWRTGFHRRLRAIWRVVSRRVPFIARLRHD